MYSESEGDFDNAYFHIMTEYTMKESKKRGDKGHMVQKREQDKAEKKVNPPF
jgi:hypothetical protein